MNSFPANSLSKLNIRGIPASDAIYLKEKSLTRCPAQVRSNQKRYVALMTILQIGDVKHL